MSENGQVVQNSLYVYAPNRVAPTVFAALFAFSMVGHIWQCCRYRSWKLTGLHPFCALLFTVGYALREVGAFEYKYDGSNNKSLILDIMSQVLIYVGPPFLELANYHVLGRLLSYIPWLAPVPPKRVLDTFGALIAAVEGLNGLGIAFTSNPDGNHQGLGQGLVLASLGVQICLIACFVVITSVFHWRCCKANVQNKAIPALPLTLYQSTAFMVIRSIYRLVEHAGNSSLDLDNPDELRSLSPLMRYEWYFYVFEGTTMLLNSLVWNIWHAGRFLPTNAKAFLAQDGKTEIDSPQEVAGPSALAPVLYLVMQLLTFGIWGLVFPQKEGRKEIELLARPGV